MRSLAYSNSQFIVRTFLILLFIFSSPNFTINDQPESKNLLDTISSPIGFENSVPHLFPYNIDEMEVIASYFEHNFNKIPRFFENMEIGMISLTKDELSIIQNNFGLFSSRLQTSVVENVLPSMDNLGIQNIHSVSQGYQLPREVVNGTVQIEKGFDGSGIKIAILDSGLDTTHPDIRNVGYQKSFILPEYGYSSEEGTFDLHGHGTHVAGIAAGGGTFPGIAPRAELVNLKVADMFGGVSSAAVIAALNEAVNQSVDVVSISLGFGITDPWGAENLLDLAVNEAVEKGKSQSRLFWEKLGISIAVGLDKSSASTWIFTMKNRFSDEWKDSKHVDMNSKNEISLSEGLKKIEDNIKSNPELEKKILDELTDD